jgi:hypothetical protein
MPSVDISQSGRGGTVIYREGDHAIRFDWEFAMEPALALLWGPPRAQWDTDFPWAVGRQSAIYDFVGREVVRQKEPDRTVNCDLDSGTLEILRR